MRLGSGKEVCLRIEYSVEYKIEPIIAVATKKNPLFKVLCADEREKFDKNLWATSQKRLGF